MKCTLSIDVYENIPRVIACVKPDLQSMQGDRATIRMREGKTKLTFVLSADDSTALRAIANTLLKALQVIEKMENV
jgi:tRNA threonylcarbamoyladenosine modification (KEOPS) complex  Pcc1 subunit